MASSRNLVILRKINKDDPLELPNLISAHPIDVRNLLEEDKAPLATFLSLAFLNGPCFLSEGLWYLDADQLQAPIKLDLKQGILLRPRETDLNTWRAEVVGVWLGGGSFSDVYNVLTTFYLDETLTLQSKVNPRVIKDQVHHAGNPAWTAEVEARISAQAGYLSAKNAIFYKEKIKKDKTNSLSNIDVEHSCIVLRRFDGSELFKHVILLESMPPDKDYTDPLLDIIVNMFHAVQEQLHNRGIISGDLKLENMILGECSSIANVDLGLSKCINDPSPAAGGTWSYMALEVIEAGLLSVAADIYSLGVAASHLLGRELYYVKTKEKAIKWAKTISFPSLFKHCGSLSPEHRETLTSMLLKMLDPAPENRGALREHILVIEKVILERRLSRIPQVQRGEIQQAYNMGVMLRDFLHPLNFLNLNDEDANYQHQYAMTHLISRILSKIDELQNLPNKKFALEIFILTIRSNVLVGSPSTAIVIHKLTEIIKEFKQADKMLVALMHDVNRLNRENSNALLGEITRIVNAISLRRRKLAPTIDNIPEMTHKFQKSIAELEALKARYQQMAASTAQPSVVRDGLFGTCQSPRLALSGNTSNVCETSLKSLAPSNGV